MTILVIWERVKGLNIFIKKIYKIQDKNDLQDTE